MKATKEETKTVYTGRSYKVGFLRAWPRATPRNSWRYTVGFVLTTLMPI